MAALVLTAGAAGAQALACPGDAQPRVPGTLLVLQVAGAAPLALGKAELAALKATSLTQKQTISAAAGTVASERSLVYGGVLLRDLLLKAGYGGPPDRATRTGVIEAVATDGYRAVFSWGELFNSSAGEQVLVITTLDGQPLDSAAGPLALRALADTRPGPRHVRNLCAVLAKYAP